MFNDEIEFTDEQLAILNATEPYIALEASAASLKTTTLTEKVRRTIKACKDPSLIAVITYTRMAAEELRERLAEDYRDGMFIGTIHALAAKFMSEQGKGNLIKKFAEDANFDEMFEVCKDLKVEGQYEYVFLDEAQDTGEGEITFIFDMIKPTNILLAYDLKQTIYQFKGSRPELILERTRAMGFKYYPLTKNFRNGSRILNFAKKIIARAHINDLSVAARGMEGELLEIPFRRDDVIGLLRAVDTYGDWAILARDNNQIRKIGNILTTFQIPYVTFKQSQLTKRQLEEKMKSNTVKLITIHSSKGLGFKNVMVYGARWRDDELYVSYVAATRAKDMLVWLTGVIR